eukprot:CAMPEP_0175827818 /NCGR_PEP_ID=MMETSP0107_2-20121207/12480_1 /TAXON_ID=195067 ORGANISM="Goniomonas pacifica, Strain CCMP1869" /NCGR_SAMPLE_ID=MMETSP0107_2 /ASSEMBLY_ACC=CAM_ASM_000203 /LENGTH=117 /DNA_ID=CAMNT_0017140507 /DNA_START=275 /DNA_END=628 /DNA_ORIENTATION=-
MTSQWKGALTSSSRTRRANFRSLISLTAVSTLDAGPLMTICFGLLTLAICTKSPCSFSTFWTSSRRASSSTAILPGTPKASAAACMARPRFATTNAASPTLTAPLTAAHLENVPSGA